MENFLFTNLYQLLSYGRILPVLYVHCEEQGKLATTKEIVSNIMKSPEKKQEIAKKIRIRQVNASWLVANYDNLRPKYKNNFIAVHRRKVVAYDPDLKVLTHKLEAIRKDRDIFATALIAEKRPVLILCVVRKEIF